MFSNLNRRGFISALLFSTCGLSVSGNFPGFLLETDEALESLLSGRDGKIIKTLGAWKRQREIIKRRWLDYLGPIPSNPADPHVSIISEDHTDGIVRQLIEYEGEPGIRVKAYLLRPQNIQKRLPGIVALHSTSDNQMAYIAGVEKGNIVPFGYNLAKQGNVVICPQCFLWHDQNGCSYEEIVQLFHSKHPGSKGMAKMLFDAQRAVDVLKSLNIVNKKKIGTMGHSLGAKEAFYLGAFDDRVKVIVSNEGGIGINFSNWDAVWYLGKEIHQFGHKHHEILALVGPKPFLLIGGDSADGAISQPYIDAVKPVYRLYNKKNINIELYNHGTGHGVHPEAERRTYEWMARFL